MAFRRFACAFGVVAALLVSSTDATAQYSPSLPSSPPRSIAGVRFHFRADGPVRGGFGLAGARLIFGSESGSVYALDKRDGSVLWRTSVGSPVLSTPAIAGARAYFTTWDNALHAFDIASGRELWRVDLGRTLGASDYWEYYVSSPILADGRLYVGSGDGKLYAIDPATGRIAWASDVGARIRTTPAISGAFVAVGTMSGHVVALDRRSGGELWRFATKGAAQDFSFKDNDTRSVVTAPIIVGDTVIAGGRDGYIYGIDRRSGKERWRETHDGGSWILGLAGDKSRFYAGGGSAFVIQAADPATGKEVWRTPTGNAMFGGIARAGDVLVSNGSQGGLLGFDANTGAQLWSFRLPEMALSSPLVADGVVYTGADDGSVYAVDTATSRQPALDRYVYSYTNPPAAGFFWFKPDTLASITGAFGRSGYAALGSEDLARALATPGGKRGRKIIVLADTRLPDAVDAVALRRFLDGGGVLVLIGPDPVIYSFDSEGAPQGVDPEKEKAAFGLDQADKARDYGYNFSTFTPAARGLGLTGHFVTIGWARPEQVSTVLAADRSGMATAWTKRFPNGGLLVQLPVPRSRAIDLSAYINAIDLASARAAAEKL
jgi:outer membrane protein assembly factor BamB